MRTTLTIHDALFRRAKEAAAQRDCSIGEVIEEALRVSLAAQPKQATHSVPGRPLKTFKGSGVQPGLDLLSNANLLEAMEGR